LTTRHPTRLDAKHVRPGVSYSAAFGGAIAPNLILYGEVLGMIVPDPSVSYGGVSTTSSGTTMALVGLGPGLAYYLEPTNLYLSGTVTLSHLEVSYNYYSDDYYYSDYTPSTESYTGVGFSAVVGKEWWGLDQLGPRCCTPVPFRLHAGRQQRRVDDQLTGSPCSSPQRSTSPHSSPQPDCRQSHRSRLVRTC